MNTIQTWIIFTLACAGAVWFADLISGWILARFAVDLRHLRARRRWDRPGAQVLVLPDGREGAIEEVFRHAAAGDIALVIFEDAPPEWHPVMSLAPLPRIVQGQEAA